MTERVLFYVSVPLVYRTSKVTEPVSAQEIPIKESVKSSLTGAAGNIISRRKKKTKRVKFNINKGKTYALPSVSEADDAQEAKKNKKEVILIYPAEILVDFLTLTGITDYTAIPYCRKLAPLLSKRNASVLEPSDITLGGGQHAKSSTNTLSALKGSAQISSTSSSNFMGKESNDPITSTTIKQAKTSEMKSITELKNDNNVVGIDSTKVITSEQDLSEPTANSSAALSFLPSLTSSLGDSDSIMFIFTVLENNAEEYLTRLERLGIGNEEGFGTVNILPVYLSRHASRPVNSSLDDTASASNDSIIEGDEAYNMDGMNAPAGILGPNQVPQRSMRTELLQTIKSRVAVDHVIKLVNGGAEFSFDYVMLCLVASILAAVGLVTNSVVVIVASMLVSPIMGPILAITFGVNIHDKAMIRKGLISETAGLLICVLIGFIVGLIAAYPTYTVAVETSIDNPSLNVEWPPFEMSSRGTVQALLAGLVVAFFSGIGVALSILGNNTTSLVGVAISASLLPPAVNTGTLIGYAIVLGALNIDDDVDPGAYIIQDPVVLATQAGLSFCLTLINIILIIISGIMMFRLKEVSPVKNKSEFWQTHVHNARHYNSLAKDDADVQNLLDNVKNVLRNEMSNTQSSNGNPTFQTLTTTDRMRPNTHKAPKMVTDSFFRKPCHQEIDKLRKSNDFVPNVETSDTNIYNDSTNNSTNSRSSIADQLSPKRLRKGSSSRRFNQISRHFHSPLSHGNSERSAQHQVELDTLKQEMRRLASSPNIDLDKS